MAQRTKKTVKSVETPAPETTVVPPTTPAEVVAPVPATDEPVKVQSVDGVVSDKFEILHTKVNDLTVALRDLQTSLRAIQKEVVKIVKSNVKKTKTRNTNGAKKTPSGFAKPTKLSDVLCDFLGVEKGTELARTDVTRRINTYIKEHNLQDEKDKRKIHPDLNLSKVLTMKPEDNLTFFNLQTYLKSNFIRPVPVVAPAPVAVA
jgi:chromatin remodeling complex protein RSC6